MPAIDTRFNNDCYYDSVVKGEYLLQREPST